MKMSLPEKYYYRVRYLDPRTGRWLSTDPALGEYIPLAPVNDEAKKHNQNLPGMGGIYNTVNFHLYHYAGNNPVKYMDPDGRFIMNNILLGNKTKDFAQSKGKNSWYLNGSYQPSIFSNASESNPGFPIFSFTGNKNIGFGNKLDNALLLANKLKNDNNPKTEGKIEANAKSIGDGLYEIAVTVETNLSAEKTTGVVAYAGEAEIMTAGKVDQQKINDIANYSINTVMRWKNDTQNIE